MRRTSETTRSIDIVRTSPVQRRIGAEDTQERTSARCVDSHFAFRFAGVLLVDAAVVVEVEIDALVIERRDVIEILDERMLRDLVLRQAIARDPGFMRADHIPRIFGVQKVAQG